VTITWGVCDQLMQNIRKTLLTRIKVMSIFSGDLYVGQMGKANLTFGTARLGKVPEIRKIVLVVLNSRSIDHQHVKS